MLSKIKSIVSSGNARSVRAKKNIIAMAFIKGLSALCSLLIVPLSVDYVSPYEYGIWLTLSSLVVWISFFDIGLGQGLRNRFIEALETHHYRRARVYVSTAYALIASIIFCVWIVAMTASFYVDWCNILNVDRSLEQELLITVLIVITNFSLMFVLFQNRSLVIAIQKPALAAAFDASSQVLLCIVLLILTRYTTGNLIYLALAMSGCTLTSLICTNIWTYTTLLKRYRPSWRYVRFRMAKGIMSLGFLFFFLQIMSLLFYQSNNLIITHYIGPDEVTVYNIAFKYLQILPMGFTIILAPFWSAFTEAKVNEDYQWMKNARSKLIRTLQLFVVLGIVMVIVSPYVYKFFFKDVVSIPLIVTILVFVYQILNMWISIWTQLLSGLGKIRLQLICSSVCSLAYVPVCCYFCDKYGLLGLLSVTIGLPLLCNSWFGVIQTKKILNKTAKGIWDK